MGQKAPQRRHPAPPLITDELLSYLDSVFPDRCPDPKESGRSIWINVGKREVVRHLQREAAAQRKELRNQ